MADVTLPEEEKKTEATDVATVLPGTAKKTETQPLFKMDDPEPSNVQPLFRMDDPTPEPAPLFEVPEERSPDEMAVRIRAGKAFGVSPWSVTDEQVQEFEKRPFDEALNTAPQAKAWLEEDPLNRGVAADDVPTLSLYERTAKVLADPIGELKGFIRAQGREIQIGELIVKHADRSWAQMMGTDPSRAAEAEWIGGRNALKQLQQEQEAADRTAMGKFLGVGAQQLAGPMLRVMQAAAEAAAPGAAVGFTVGAVLGTTAGPPGTAAGALAGGITGAGVGAKVGSFAAAMKLEGGLAFDEYVQLPGVTRDEARGAALAVGLINGSLEFIGFGQIAKAVPGGKELFGFVARDTVREVLKSPTQRAALAAFGRRVLKAGAAEGLTEFLQEATIIVGGRVLEGKILGDTPYTSNEFDRDLKQALEAGGAGVVAGLTFGGLGSSVTWFSDQARIRESLRRQEAVKAMAEAAPLSPLQERLPEKTREFIDRVTRDGPVAEVGIPGKAFDDYWTKTVPDAAVRQGVYEALGVADQVAEAVSSGGDVVMSMGTVQSVLAPTEHFTTLFQDMRFGEDAYTANEIKDLDVKDVRQAVEDAVAEGERQRQVMAPVEAVRDRMMRHALNTGQTQTEAEATAEIFAGHARALQENFGVEDPEAFIFGKQPGQFGLDVELVTKRARAEAALPAIKDRVKAARAALRAFKGDKDSPEGQTLTRALKAAQSEQRAANRALKQVPAPPPAATPAIARAQRDLMAAEARLFEAEAAVRVALDAAEVTPLPSERGPSRTGEVTVPAGIETLRAAEAEARAEAARANQTLSDLMQGTLFQPFDLAIDKVRTSAAALGGRYTLPPDAKPVPALSRRKNGNYNGAPGGKPFTEAQVKKLVDRLTKLALSPEAVGTQSRWWYELAGEVVRNVTENNAELMERTIRVTALLSADNSLGGNISGVLDSAHDIALHGEPTRGYGRYPQVNFENLKAALAAEQFDSDLPGVSDKVMSFYRNMHDATYQVNDFAGEVTLDKWMFRAFGYTGTSFRFIGPQYGFGREVMHRVTDQVSAQLGEQLLPRQVQAMIWTAMRNENQPDPTNIGYEEYWDRAAATITWEAHPSVTSALLPEIMQQPPDVQRQFADEALRIIHPEGGVNELIARVGGVEYAADLPGQGAYEGNLSPNITTFAVLPKTEDGVRDGRVADLIANALGYIYQQDAVPWHRPDPTLRKKDSVVGVSVTIDQGEIDATTLYAHMRGLVKAAEFSAIPRLDGLVEFRFLNFDGQNEKAYVEGIQKALEAFDTNATFRIKEFRATGNYLDNDWKADANGEGYTRRISEAGRPDLLDWASDRREAFHALARTWQERLSDANRAGDGAGAALGLRPAPSVRPDGTIRLIHFSSTAGIKKLETSRHGEALSGQTRDERNRATYPEFQKRTYYGLEGPHGYRKEGGLGDTRYEASVPFNRLYDAEADPAGFRAQASEAFPRDQGAALTRWEKLIKDAGFAGYWRHDPSTGLVAAVFEDLDVETLEQPGVARDAAFEGLAQAQRGAPEAAMLAVQEANGGGVLSFVVEHAGDLTNRMSQKFSFFKGMPDTFFDKVEKVHRQLTHPFGFVKEHKQNLAANAKFLNRSLAEHTAGVDAALKRYADAHRALQVFNEPQRIARDVAVAIGEKRFDDAVALLEQLLAMEKDGTFEVRAGEFTLEQFRKFPGTRQIRYDPAELLAQRPDLTPEQAIEASRKQRDAMLRDIRASKRKAQSARVGDVFLINVLEQPADESPRASITFGDTSTLMRLFEGQADLSSILHEGSHLFMEELVRLAEQGNAQAQADVQIIRRWTGAKESPFTREHKEKFADGFEAYMFEGQAPSQALAAVFDRFRVWFTRIYGSIRAIIDRNGIEMDDEIRGVFDRLLATESEIEDARSMLPSLTAEVAAEIGLTKREQTSYANAAEAARLASEAELLSSKMAEIKRLRTKELNEKQAELTKSVEEELGEQQEYQALVALTMGKAPDGTSLDEPVKIDEAALDEQFPGRKARLTTAGPGRRVFAKGGIDPESAAEMFGYESAEDLLDALTDLPPFRRAVNERVAEEMKAFIVDDELSEGVLMNKAIDALHGDARARMLAIEFRALSRKSGTLRASVVSAARQVAQEAIARRTVAAATKPLQFLNAERKAGRLAQKAILAEDWAEATRQKHHEILQHHLYMESRKAEQEAAKILKRFRRLQRPGVRENIDPGYLDQIDTVLENIDIRQVTNVEANKRAALLAWVREREAEGLIVAIPESVLARAHMVPYRTLTMQEFRDADASVRHIEHLGKLKNKLLTAQKRREFEAVRDEVMNSVLSNNRLQVEKWRHDNTIPDAVTRGLKKAWNAHLITEFQFEMLDGFKLGPVWNALFRPLSEAADRESRMRRDAAKEVRRLWNLYSLAERTTMDTPIGGGKVMVEGVGRFNRSKLLSAALNLGNEVNRQRLQDGEGWTDAQVQSLIDTLDKRDWEFVQGVWDLLETFKAPSFAFEKEMTGLEPEAVEATPVETRFGTLRGGYYPIKYDAARSWAAEIFQQKENIKDAFGGNWATAQTKRGHLQARTEGGLKENGDAAPLRLNLNVIAEHLDNVIHDLTHRRALIDVQKLIRDPQLKAALTGVLGHEAYGELQPWLNRVAGEMQHPDPVEGIMRWANNSASLVSMGFKVTTGLVQFLGYTQTIAYLGPAWAARGMKAFIGSPFDTTNFALNSSEFMRSRASNFDRDARDVLKDFGPNTPMRAVQEAAFYHIGMMDMAVSIPTWTAAYERARSQGKNHDTAVQEGNAAVRITQGSGRASSLARVQTGSAAFKMWTKFMSYFMVFHNMMVRSGRMKKSGRINWPLFAAHMMWLWFIPAVFNDLLVGRGPDEDKDEDELLWGIKKVVSYPFQGLVFVRDIVNGAVTGWDVKPAAVEAMSTTAGALNIIGREFVAEPLGLTEDKELTRSEAKELSMALAYWGRFPGRQAWLTADAFMQLQEGEDISLFELFVTGKKRN